MHDPRSSMGNTSAGYNHSRISVISGNSSAGYNQPLMNPDRSFTDLCFWLQSLHISDFCSRICAFLATTIHIPQSSMENSSMGTPTLVSTTDNINWLTIYESPLFVEN